MALVAALDRTDMELMRQREHRQCAEQHQWREAGEIAGAGAQQFRCRWRSRQTDDIHPNASIAPSFSNASNAIAKIRPRLCSTALALRVPNSIANAAIINATYSALSCQAGTCAVSSRINIAKLIATAFNCKAM